MNVRTVSLLAAALVALGCGPDLADVAAEQSTAEQSTAEQSTAEQSTAEQSVAEQSVADPLPPAVSPDLLVGGRSAPPEAPVVVPAPPPQATTATTPGPLDGDRPVPSGLTELVRPGPSALFDVDGAEQAASAAVPVALTIEGIGVVAAPVRAVGVEADGALEVPGADEVGWYRFGPRPGDTGSSVLAAHVAFDGRDGVFRHLTDLDPGSALAVRFADGSVRRFEAVERAQYRKDELPFDAVFRRDGDPGLVLITCGGDFNPDLRSYDDNVVVYAVPAPTSARAAAA